MAALPATAGLSFEPLEKINHIVAAAPRAFSDAGPCDGEGKVVLGGYD